jgi:FtsP/CotA-like multicopper oxidase with cupredoxin domain
MVLEDDAPPVLKSLTLGGVPAQLDPPVQLRATGKAMVNIRPTFSPTTQITRRLTLNEDLSVAGFPLEMLVNNTKYMTEVGPNPTPIPGTTTFDVSEIPQVGDTEIWEIINLTADTHPMHTHLTAFQLLDRRPFNVAAYTAAYNTANPAWNGVYKAGLGPPLPYGSCAPGGPACGGNLDPATAAAGLTTYTGPAVPAAGMELGWKDTIRMNPGEVTRILVRFAPTDELAGTTAAGTNYYSFEPWEYPGYVWHCHIVDHEDNEMMRPLAIKCPAGATNCVKP